MLSGELTFPGATSQRHFGETDRLCGPSEFSFFCKQLQKFLPGGVGHCGGHLDPDFLSKLPGSWQKCQPLDPSQTKQREPPGLRTRHQGHLKLLWVFINGPHSCPGRWRDHGLETLKAHSRAHGDWWFSKTICQWASVRTDISLCLLC